MKLYNKFLIPTIAILILAFAFISFRSVTITGGTADKILDSQMHAMVSSVENQLRMTEEIVDITLSMMDTKHISLAQTLAFMIAEDPGKMEYDQMVMLADLFGVDEVHVTDEQGVLYWGSEPGFYGYDFQDGDQTRPLLAILQDPSLTIAQEPQARGVDGVIFQYISVSRIDTRGIVQVGVSMDRIEEIRTSMSVQNLIDGMQVGQSGGVFVLNSDNIVVADSTRAMLGKNLSTQNWVKTMFSDKEGRMEYEYEGVSYSSYFSIVDDRLIVTYFLTSELDGYTTDALWGILPMGLGAIILVTVVTLLLLHWIMKKIFWYECLLDSLPFPITVTDMNRNWTFVNKAVEDLLGKKRKEVFGRPCCEWGAAICNTDNCGINCLERGQNTTTFEQWDLNFRVDTSYLIDKKNNKIGHIEFVQNITEMVESQKAEALLVSEIENVASSFISSSKQISEGAQSLAQGSTDQAASIQELSNSIAEISEKTKSNADMAKRAATLADSIKVSAEKGSSQMDEMMDAVNEINNASGQISKVIKVIDDIAFQTNILALNAAVEAARAGQHGKGFAVVAEEVRNLAAKSAEAAKDTGSLIENSIEKANLGVQIASDTSESLTMIVSGVNESNQLVGEIAKSSEEQSQSIGHLNAGIDQVAQVVQQNSATAEESAAASTEMSSQANALKQLIDSFEDKYHIADGANQLSDGR